MGAFMLFLVPEAEDAAPESTTTEGNAEDKQFNVELDLDDAPFLDEPEPPKPPSPDPAPTPAPKADAPAKTNKFSNLKGKLLAHKKKVMLASGALLLLIIVGVAVNMFFFGAEKAEEPTQVATPAESAEPAEPVRIVVPSAPETSPAPAQPKFSANFEVFWVPIKGSEGEVRFLVLEFSIPTDEAILLSEINAKKLVLRDAVFYFLRNSELPLQLDNVFAEGLREDIVSVLNEHLVSGKVQKVLFSNFFVEDS